MVSGQIAAPTVYSSSLLRGSHRECNIMLSEEDSVALTILLLPLSSCEIGENT